MYSRQLQPQNPSSRLYLWVGMARSKVIYYFDRLSLGILVFIWESGPDDSGVVQNIFRRSFGLRNHATGTVLGPKTQFLIRLQLLYGLYGAY